MNFQANHFVQVWHHCVYEIDPLVDFEDFIHVEQIMWGELDDQPKS